MSVAGQRDVVGVLEVAPCNGRSRVHREEKILRGDRIDDEGATERRDRCVALGVIVHDDVLGSDERAWLTCGVVSYEKTDCQASCMSGWGVGVWGVLGPGGNLSITHSGQRGQSRS